MPVNTMSINDTTLREYLTKALADATTTLVCTEELSQWDRGYIAALEDIARDFFPNNPELWI